MRLMLRFSSDVVEPRERIEFWDDMLARTLAAFRTELAGEHAFRVEIGMQMAGEFPIVRVEGVGYRGTRGEPEIARSGDHFYAASILLDGQTVLRCRGEERQLEPGDVFLLDTMHKVEFGLERPYRHLVVRLPRQLIEACLRRPDLLCGSVLPQHHPLAGLFAGYLASGYQMADRLSPTAAAMFNRHLVDLLVEAFAPHGTEITNGQGARAARLRAIKADVSKNLGRADIRVSAVALRQGVTPRYIQMLFEEEGTTFTAYTLEMRLKRSHAMLSDLRYAHWTIGAIALEAGFADLSYFNRTFRRRYGASPSDVRAGALPLSLPS
jgi:AraC-like DNA-binding protein